MSSKFVLSFIFLTLRLKKLAIFQNNFLNETFEERSQKPRQFQALTTKTLLMAHAKGEGIRDSRKPSISPRLFHWETLTHLPERGKEEEVKPVKYLGK